MIKSDIFSHLPMKNVGFIFQMKFALLRCQQFCWVFLSSYFCEI